MELQTKRLTISECLMLQMAKVVNSGALLPDSLILDVLHSRLARGRECGEAGVLLDGFPRTRAQAEALGEFADVQLALNLNVNEEVSSLNMRQLAGHPSPRSLYTHPWNVNPIRRC